MITKYPTQSELQEVFELRVDFRNGYETLWRKGYTAKCGRVYKEKLVKCKPNHNEGYCQVSFKGRLVYYHTIVWILTNGDIPENLMTDHEDGDRIHNQLSNLRLVTSRDNGGNQEVHRNGKLVGCTYAKRDKKWQARININGKTTHLGSFNTEEEAHERYKQAVIQVGSQ